MHTLRIAFGLMTTLPIKLPEDWTAGDNGRASVWYPFVGMVIGALTWLAWNGASLIFPAWVAGVLTLVVWVALTGGLHLDGLADCCDGLLVSAPVERRLEIMKDPHVGADFAAGFRRSFIAWGAIIPLVIAILLGTRGAFSALAGLGVAALVLWLAVSRIGGVTGDVFGMVVEIVETTVLLAFLAGAS